MMAVSVTRWHVGMIWGEGMTATGRVLGGLFTFETFISLLIGIVVYGGFALLIAWLVSIFMKHKK